MSFIVSSVRELTINFEVIEHISYIFLVTGKFLPLVHLLEYETSYPKALTSVLFSV